MTPNQKLGIEITNLLTRAQAYQRLCNLEIANLDEMNQLKASIEMKARVSREALDRDLDLFTDLMIGVQNVFELYDAVDAVDAAAGE